MMFFELATCPYVIRETSLVADGVEGYMPNVAAMGEGRELHYDGEEIVSIFRYDAEDDIYLLTKHGREICLSVHEGFDLQLVERSFTTISHL